MTLRLVPQLEQNDAPGSVCDAHFGQNGIIRTDLFPDLFFVFLRLSLSYDRTPDIRIDCIFPRDEVISSPSPARKDYSSMGPTIIIL
jgi:hypothetical protein